MKFHLTPLEGAILVELQPYGDERGFFARVFCQDEFASQGLPTEIKQSNLSFNQQAGTLRGMHFQRQPHGEAKLVRCITGAVYDVIVDLRPGSATYCQWYAVRLDAQTHYALFIPAGIAHGFLTLVDRTMVLYEMFEAYHPGSASGVRYNDPVFGIEWPDEIKVIAEKDQAWPDFRPEEEEE